jgi:hypothetical protein
VILAGSEALPRDACLLGFGNKPEWGYAATSEHAGCPIRRFCVWGI